MSTGAWRASTRFKSLLKALPADLSGELQEAFAEVLAEAERDQDEAIASLRLRQADKLKKVRKAQASALRALESTHQDALSRYQEALVSFVGPEHEPPETATRITSKVARPPIQAAYWFDQGWHCLRLEERTVGHHRETAYIRSDTGLPALRFHPDTEKWMRWLSGLAEEFGLMPTDRQVRVIFYPGLAYTFMAWREVDARPVFNLHPMDPDNVCKSSLDAIQSVPYSGEPRLHGAFRNDTQVVDLLVFRLPQTGEPPVDRIALGKIARAKRKARKKDRPKRPRPVRQLARPTYKVAARSVRRLVVARVQTDENNQ